MGGSMYSSQSNNHAPVRRPLFPVPAPVTVPASAPHSQSEGTSEGSVVRKEKKPTVSLKDAVMRHLGASSPAPATASQGQGQGPEEKRMKREEGLLPTPGSDKAKAMATAAAEKVDKDRPAAVAMSASAKPRYPLDCIPDGNEEETDEYVSLALDELTDNLKMVHFLAEDHFKFREEKEKEVEKLRNELVAQKIWNKDLLDENAEIIEEKHYLLGEIRELEAAMRKAENKALQEENKEIEGLKQEIFVQKTGNKALREEIKFLREKLQEATFLKSHPFNKNAGPMSYQFNPDDGSRNIHEVANVISHGVQNITTIEKLLQDPSLLKKLDV